ncbi:hypothetical protein V6Z12_D08G069500 [Gossypium hirsutum]
MTSLLSLLLFSVLLIDLITTKVLCTLIHIDYQDLAFFADSKFQVIYSFKRSTPRRFARICPPKACPPNDYPPNECRSWLDPSRKIAIGFNDLSG